MPSISVVIPTYNRKDALKETLLALNNQTLKDFEVIIIDDGSTDGIADIQKSMALTYPLKYFKQDHSGIAAARNHGIEKAGSKLVLFTDDHMIADKKLIEEHVNCHNKFKDSNIAAVRGRVEYVDETHEIPEETKYILENQIKNSPKDQDPFRNFITNNLSVNKDVFIQIGGFDEDFVEYGLEDSEAGYRLTKFGFKLCENPNAVVYNFRAGLGQEVRTDRRRQVGRSSVLFYKKHPNLKVKLILSTHIFSIILYYLYSIFSLFVRSLKSSFTYNFLKGIKEGFKKYKGIKRIKLSSRFRKKKILLVSHNSRLEGAPISLYLLAKYLNKDKYDVIYVMPRNGRINSLLKIDKIRTMILKGPSFLYPEQIRKMIDSEGIDLLHANTLSSYWAVNGAHKAGIPSIWHIRECPKYFRPSSLEKKFQKTNKIIAISKWVKQVFNLSDYKSIVIYNGVDLNIFSNNASGEKVRHEFGINDNEILAGLIGSISERKGADHFIIAASEILKQHNNIKFMVVGNYLPGESFKGKFLKLIKKLKLDNKIIFTGVRKDIPNVVAAMDIVVNSSISEPFGRTLIEGMALKKPVIGTNVGGIPEIIDDGKTGLLVMPNNPKQLTKSILKLANDKNLRNKMGIAGRKRIEDLFTIERHVKEVENIYDKLLSGKR